MIMQFRYYGDNDTRNQPTSVKKKDLFDGKIFSGYLPITKLGIQTLPGTKFYLNNSTSPIIVGYTGIYEIDLTNISTINSLSFDISSLRAIEGNSNAYLIIDILCNGEGS